MKHYLFCFFALMVAIACNENNKQVETLIAETNSIHDAAMKDMANMNRVARQLKDFMISATMTAEQSAEYTNALKAAGDAENEMMDWMANYKEPVGQPAAEAVKYLTEKKASIEANQVKLKAAAEGITKLLPE